MRDLGHFENATRTAALSISADGSAVAGYACIDDQCRAFRWKEGEGYKDLGLLPSAEDAFGSAISANGRVVVGHLDFGGGAFRWTETDGMQDLGHPSDGFSPVARAVNADGSVVVGTCSVQSPFPDRHATVWTESLGMVDLNVYLPTIGIDLGSLILYEATGVSYDGTAITGFAFDESSRIRAWVVTGFPTSRRGCDWDGSGEVTIVDYLNFVEAFVIGVADFNASGRTDSQDYLDFMTCYFRPD